MAAVVEYINHATLPETPLNYYLTIEGFARARDMLFGAAYARAKVLRARHPDLPARIYASCSTRDPERLMFFGEMGLRDTDAEYVMRKRLSEDGRLPKPPVGMRLAHTRLADSDACERLLSRINPFSITAHSEQWLERERQQPFFDALAMLEEENILGEAIVNGYGVEGRVLMIYTLPRYRRRGVARALLAAAEEMFIQQGYAAAAALVWERCRAAMGLFERCGYARSAQSILYPGIYL